MSSGRMHPNYLGVWVWLILLMVGGVLVSYLPLARSAVALLIFVVAAVKASLVALYFMHLKFERGVICALAVIPIVLVVGLTLLLFPDFVLHH